MRKRDCVIDVTHEKHSVFIPAAITPEQAKDTGMAMVLICLLIGQLAGKPAFFPAAIVLLLANMIWPKLYRPVAKLWLGLSNLLGAVVSRILLSALFFLLVTPIGLIRRLCGADALQVRRWKKDQTSVFRVRNHTFSSRDISKPY
jgi:hypothetical protein